jgi:hypothetical protein
VKLNASFTLLPTPRTVLRATALDGFFAFGATVSAPKPSKRDAQPQRALARNGNTARRAVVRISASLHRLAAKLAARGHLVDGQVDLAGAVTASMKIVWSNVNQIVWGN